ncbi:MAG: S46 family peptidase [Lewinellaceae bacterium]|nr:S46 family peptidase [Phaeodactylibacter sp.]MCB9349691.1 S46 family peptidase [Lewinellaceae bacterium]
MIKRLILIALVLSSFRLARATEGMWLPLLLQQLNEAEMQSMGMKMTADDIYSVNQGSLKDAIVHFGGFCTAEVISSQGLLLTNHHCGDDYIQSHSTMEQNYYLDGFWPRSKKEELPNPGLFATFIVRIEDVTDKVLENVAPGMHDKERQAWVSRNTERVKYEAQREEYQDVMIRPFFEGNQYFLFVTETYRDVRLVAAPPASIGKFGADTDNWVWPRHTGDFSVFRIYAGPDNKPAEYAAENVPFQPRHFLPVSLDGVDAGDFTLVFGFPGRTEEYLPSPAIEQRVDVLNPIRIGIRDRTLAVMNEAMRNDPEVRLQYVSKQSRIANSWKKWIGESQGIHKTNGIAKRKAYEAEFQKRVAANPEWKEPYGDILGRFEQLYAEQAPYAKAREYIGEIAGRNIELFRYINTLHGVAKSYNASGAPGLAGRMDKIKNYVEGFFKDYRPEVDRQVFASLMEVYFNELSPQYQSEFAIEQFVASNKDYQTLASLIYGKSQLIRPDVMRQALEAGPDILAKTIQEDYAYHFVRGISEVNEGEALKEYQRIQEDIDLLQRKYMKAQMEVFSEKRFYPDANGTLRVSYGKVDGYTPRDAVQFEPHTYLEGIIEKYVPGDYEFDVPDKLRQLYNSKDYGPYGEAGKMPVCFIGANHTTGGNSGSPAIDAYGNLVGLNFDRVWEGTMSDINYDASICRNIMVDIRYVLFVIDKLGGAGHLVEEMELVHPKK